MIPWRRIRRSRAADPAGWDGDAQDPLILLLREAAQADDLAPGDPRAAATRSAVLGAFGHATWPAASRTRTRRQPRPALALALAGLVTLSAVGAVAASAPGGLLYDARITLEEALLPSGQAGRAQAQVERLAARVAEVEHALRTGDARAAAASLAAFTRIATAAADDGEAGPVDVEMATRVRAQLAALARLELPEPGLQAARDDAAAAARRLLGAFEQPAPDPPGPPGPGPSASPGTEDAGSPAPAGSPVDGSGSGSGSPRQTARPSQATPRPDASTAAPQGPASSGTPRPGTSPGSGPGGSGEPDAGGSSTPGPGGSGSGGDGGSGGGGTGGRP